MVKDLEEVLLGIFTVLDTAFLFSLLDIYIVSRQLTDKLDVYWALVRSASARKSDFLNPPNFLCLFSFSGIGMKVTRPGHEFAARPGRG